MIERSVIDNRRQLGAIAILAIVLLRLAIGWHFFTAGMDKIERTADGGYRVSFSAAPFLGMAKGPFAESFKAMVPSGHDWQKLLAVPHERRPLTDAEAKTAGEHPPYESWSERIKADWQQLADAVTKVPGLTEDQIARAKAIVETKKAELDEYLADEERAIADYQHELWRLDKWRAKPEAESLPFEADRITKKETTTTATGKGFVTGVTTLETELIRELRELLDEKQQTNSSTVAAMETATTGPEEARLSRVNLGATVLTLGVGICLLLGMFTRTASIAGAVFLVSVIATQPPWVATSEPTIINQVVELAGLLVLAGTGAGRWLGLDYISWAMFHKNDD